MTARARVYLRFTYVYLYLFIFIYIYLNINRASAHISIMMAEVAMPPGYRQYCILLPALAVTLYFYFALFLLLVARCNVNRKRLTRTLRRLEA